MDENEVIVISDSDEEDVCEVKAVSQLIPGSGSATLLTGLNRNPSGQTTFGFDRKLKRSKIPGSQRQQHRHLEEQEIEHKGQIYRQPSVQAAFARAKNSKNKRSTSEDQLQISISKGQSRNGNQTTELKIVYSDHESGSPSKTRIKPNARKMISSFSPRLEADRLAGTLLPKKRPLEPDHLSSLKNKKTRISTPSPILLVPVQTMKDEEATCKPDASLRATKEGNPCETVKIAVDAFKSVLKEKLPNHEYVIVEKRLTKRMGAFNGNFLTDKKLIKLITEKERMVKSSDADSSYFHIKIVLDELKVYTIKADAVAAAAVVEPSHEDRKMEDSVLPGFRVKTEPALSTTEPMKKMVKLTAVASTDNKKESEVKKDCSPEFSIRETNESPVVVPGLNGNPESIPCSSKGSKTPEDDNPASSKLKKKPSKHHVVKLKKALKQCQKEIEKLEVKEVDFENEDDDTYLRVSRYKSKMVQIYKKLADIEGREANMGRQTDKTFKFKGTRYPEINQKISRFVNKRKDRGEEYFPDYKDVLTIFEKCNEAHGLGLTGRGMAHEAEEAFKTIGRMLQKRRVDDDHMIMLSYLSEGEADVDPAENVPEMEQKLRASETERENKMTKIMAEFTKKAAEAKEVAEEVPDNEPVVHMEEEDDTGKVSEEDEDIHEDDLVKDTIENAGKEGEEEDLVVDSESSSDEDDNDDSNDFPNNVDEMSDGDTGSDPKPSSSTYEIKDGDEESILPPILDVEEDTNDDASSIEEVDPDGAPIMN